MLFASNVRDAATVERFSRPQNPSPRLAPKPMRPRSPITARRGWLAGAGLLWAGCVVAGFATLARYEHAPGDAGSSPLGWPEACRLQPAGERPQLLLFLHPRCPCSQATVSEFARLVAKQDAVAAVTVVFSLPADADGAWRGGRLWRAASKIPDARCVADPGGVISRQFGAETSGFVTVYGPRGKLRFAGGITGSRGHEGANPGAESALLAIGQELEPRRNAVFGCRLCVPCTEKDAT